MAAFKKFFGLAKPRLTKRQAVSKILGLVKESDAFESYRERQSFGALDPSALSDSEINKLFHQLKNTIRASRK